MKNIAALPVLFLLGLFSLNAQTPSFEDFKAQFEQVSLPFSLSATDLQAQVENRAAHAKRLSWEFYQFLPELERSAQYSNMPVFPEPVAVFETEDNVAFLYNIARGLGKGSKSYSITVYDRFGNYIATNFVAGINHSTIASVSIDAALIATVKELDLGSNIEGTQVIDLTAPGNPDQLEWSSLESSDAASMAAAK